MSLILAGMSRTDLLQIAFKLRRYGLTVVQPDQVCCKASAIIGIHQVDEALSLATDHGSCWAVGKGFYQLFVGYGVGDKHLRAQLIDEVQHDADRSTLADTAALGHTDLV